MDRKPKLFLYSLTVKDEQFVSLDRLVGKTRGKITLGLILNATDIIDNSEGWVKGIVESIETAGYKTRTIDLRESVEREKEIDFQDVDVVWVCGGHTYYLRWILSASGADKAIIDFVNKGNVYAGWSAGAIVAGPTTKHFDLMGDNPTDAPQTIFDGLHLTEKVIVPHIDNPDFDKGAALAGRKLTDEGYQTIFLRDDQAVVIDGDHLEII